MNELITFGLLAFTSFITLINPMGSMPIFMTMTAELTSRERGRTARKASIISFFTLLLFAFMSDYLFDFFGISINSLKIVGGVIFFLMGMDMLQARLTKVKVKDSEVKSYINDISITPLAIPIICGPGAITNAILLMKEADDVGKKFVLIATIFAVIAISYIVLSSSSRIIKLQALM